MTDVLGGELMEKTIEGILELPVGIVIRGRGSKKYGDRNWEKGQPLARMIDSALRHLCCALEGQTDEDHVIACAWNMMCIADTQERIKAGLLPKELDDLPKLPEPPAPTTVHFTNEKTMPRDVGLFICECGQNYDPAWRVSNNKFPFQCYCGIRYV